MLDSTQRRDRQVSDLIAAALAAGHSNGRLYMADGRCASYAATTGRAEFTLPNAPVETPLPAPLTIGLDSWRDTLRLLKSDPDALWQSYGEFVMTTLDKCKTHRIDPVPQASDLMREIARDCGVEETFGIDTVHWAITEAINNHELVPDLVEPYEIPERLALRERPKLEATPGGVIKFKLQPFDALVLSTAPPYLVRELIPRVGVAVVWGAPKCGKTFWALDLAMHVALGWQYRGRRTESGPVVYLALEGRSGFLTRVAAFRQEQLAEHTGPVPFSIITNPLVLKIDHKELIENIRRQAVAPKLIAIDTLN